MQKQAKLEIRLVNNEVYFYDLPCEAATLPAGLLVTPKGGTSKLFPYGNIKKVDFGTRLVLGGGKGKVITPI